jgi:hypothetical protein
MGTQGWAEMRMATVFDWDFFGHSQDLVLCDFASSEFFFAAHGLTPFLQGFARIDFQLCATVEEGAAGSD